MCALLLGVERPVRPGPRVEVAGRGLIAVRQAGVPVLLAEVDGHDRLVAAFALRLADRGRAERETETLGSRCMTTAEALQRQSGAAVRRAEEAVNRRFARDLETIETACGTTRAWPLPGGTPAWQALRHEEP
jgi:hypothetical protein